MRDIYLGDSYDLVKRFWSESLRSIAPLYAHERFVPAAIRTEYAKVTSIPVFELPPDNPFGILLDPDTGIPLPTDSVKGVNASHASLPFILQLSASLRPMYVICFDQSYHRSHKLSRQMQRQVKREFLRDHGMASFYYVSHAPFLFATPKVDALEVILERLISLGIPKKCFESDKT
ncbi:MAG TPA: hypothetical protein VNW97_21470 [Candidatus Saccharimonadales bacterium]|nr:hypothetical protein [Candidatus Saccharimonadales bacterium]